MHTEYAYGVKLSRPGSGGPIGGLDAPTTGAVVVEGQLLTGRSTKALARLRRRSIGYVPGRGSRSYGGSREQDPSGGDSTNVDIRRRWERLARQCRLRTLLLRRVTPPTRGRR